VSERLQTTAHSGWEYSKIGQEKDSILIRSQRVWNTAVFPEVSENTPKFIPQGDGTEGKRGGGTKGGTESTAQPEVLMWGQKVQILEEKQKKGGKKIVAVEKLR